MTTGRLAGIVLGLGCASAAGALAVDGVPLGLPPELAATRPDPRAVALGERLFFDPVLSIDRTVSCSSCHDPEHGFADDEPFSPGVLGRRTIRNTPTIVNRALGKAFSWDGSKATLEEQVVAPIANELEMALPVAEAVERLAGDEAYAAEFAEVFGAAPTEALLADALAAYVRAQLVGDSPVDRFRHGDADALSTAERSGFWFFESRGGCWRCHAGANFTDEDFHNTGIGTIDGEPTDGRFAFTSDDADRGRFKTPTLRGVRDTAPYMHDGSLATLEDVVDFYRKGGHANANLDAFVRPLEMSDADAANLVAFLKSL